MLEIANPIDALAFEDSGAEKWRRIGQDRAAEGHLDNAIEAYLLSLSLDADNPPVYFELGELLLKRGKHDAALSALRKSVVLAPYDGHICQGLGQALIATGHADEGRVYLARAVEIDPRDRGFVRALADYDSACGRIAEAANGFCQLIAIDPADCAAHRNLAFLSRYTKGDPHIAEMQTLLARADLSLEDRIHLGFALFDAHDKAGNHELALHFLIAANADCQTRNGQAPGFGDFSDRTAFFSEDRMSSLLRSAFGRNDVRPLFIIGMPRSGTGLIESVLAAHVGVSARRCERPISEIVEAHFGATNSGGPIWHDDGFNAERCRAYADAYLGEIAGAAESGVVFIDRTPLNFRWLGFIAAILPDARFIHCLRDPLDTCFSIFADDCGAHGHPFGHDLDLLANSYLDYTHLMAHWQRVLPGRILPVRFERMLAEPDAETRRLLDFCGLGFDPNCLSAQIADRTHDDDVLGLDQTLPRARPKRVEPYRHALGPLVAIADRLA